MRTFRDLLRVIATNPGEAVTMQPLTSSNSQHWSIISETNRPSAVVVNNSVIRLSINYHRISAPLKPTGLMDIINWMIRKQPKIQVARVSIPGKLTRPTFRLDDPLDDLSRFVRKPHDAVISELLAYSPRKRIDMN